MTIVIVIKGNLHVDIDIYRGKQCKDTERRWASTGHGPPEVTKSEEREQEQILPHRPQEKPIPLIR